MRTSILATASGSPPHTRGKSGIACRKSGGRGITPAYAGKIACAHRLGTLPADHPRIRGENCCFLLFFMHILGSPPHTRGKSGSPSEVAEGSRITPAYAGKIHTPGAAPLCRSDHPRIRGENVPSVPSVIEYWGSPPHTRGKYSPKSPLDVP